MIIRFCATLLIWLCLAVPSLAQQTAYAKFSPIEVSASSAFETLNLQKFEFGKPLTVIDGTDEHVQINHDGKQVWLRRADVLMPPDLGQIVPGAGISATKRPTLRFWNSLSQATEFLTATNVRKAAPDLEEVQIKGRFSDLSMPIMAADVVDVMGQSSVTMAAVMLPMDTARVKAFDALRGAQSKKYEIVLVVDASPDAVTFNRQIADALYRRLRRSTTRAGDVANIRLGVFGANFFDNFKDLGAVDEARIQDLIAGPAGSKLSQAEPLLQALHSVSETLDPTADKRIVIGLSGAEIETEAYISKLRKRVNLRAPELGFPDETSLFLVQATPEPSDTLRALSQAPIRIKDIGYVPFSSKVQEDIFVRINKALNLNTERGLDEEELLKACKTDGANPAFPCVFPFAATTETSAPKPTRRGQSSDWYSTIAWVVVDGLMLKRTPAN